MLSCEVVCSSRDLDGTVVLEADPDSEPNEAWAVGSPYLHVMVLLNKDTVTSFIPGERYTMSIENTEET